LNIGDQDRCVNDEDAYGKRITRLFSILKRCDERAKQLAMNAINHRHNWKITK
jgi:hypothetical protein